MASPANVKRRICGKLSEKEIKNMKKTCYNISDMFSSKVTCVKRQRTPQPGPTTEKVNNVQCTVSCVRTGSDATRTSYGGVHSGDNLESTLATQDPRAGIMKKNITHRDADMNKVINLPTTPGGSVAFQETDITSISDMISKWEEQERNCGSKEEGKRVSKGRRVSELSMRFEEGGPLSERGEHEGGNHINKTGGRPSILERRHPSTFSNFEQNSPSKGGRTVCKLRKLNTHSKPNFKSKYLDSDTESRGGRDWSISANRKPGNS